MNINAADTDKDLLAQQCHDLSNNIRSLVFSQGKKSCVERLDFASTHIDVASRQIMTNNNTSAKHELEHAILSLQYAQLDNCNRYIQISHSIVATQKIKNALLN